MPKLLLLDFWIVGIYWEFVLLLFEKDVEQAINIPYYCSTNAVYQEIDMYTPSTVWLEQNSQHNTTALLTQSTQVSTPKWEPHPPYIGTTANGGRRHTQESCVGGRSTERAIAKEFGKRTNNEGRIARARCALLGSESGDGTERDVSPEMAGGSWYKTERLREIPREKCCENQAIQKSGQYIENEGFSVQSISRCINGTTSSLLTLPLVSTFGARLVTQQNCAYSYESWSYCIVSKNVD